MTTNPTRDILNGIKRQLHDEDPAAFHGADGGRDCPACNPAAATTTPEPSADRIAAALYRHEWPPNLTRWDQAPARDREIFLAQAGAVVAELHRMADETPQPKTQAVRGELWSLLDWTFWGSGMGDIFRETLADTMVAAISPEQREQAEQLMEAWHASGRQPLGHRQREELNGELKAAQGAIARVRAVHQPDDEGECRDCCASFDPCPTIAALDEPAATQPGKEA